MVEGVYEFDTAKRIEGLINKAKEEGRLQGQIDLLKEIKCIYKGFVDVREADEYVLDFLKRKMKAEKVV
jgi:hypothetical protein